MKNMIVFVTEKAFVLPEDHCAFLCFQLSRIFSKCLDNWMDCRTIDEQNLKIY